MPDEFDTKEESLDSVTGHDPTRIVEVPDHLGPYRLLRLLGRGGMGEVWLAQDTKLDREVAVKLMRRELMGRDDAIKRFYREARAVARLNHPNIVQVYTIGEERSIIYMVMEYVDGETVSQRLKRVGPLSLEESVGILLQAVEGLGYAHARGIIHRDIKPSNLMLTSDFRVKIADFGLAKMIEQDSQMTVAGTAIGSPNYMSPEQARGEEADHRSDIYALGISFYQMLTNELPFTGQTPLTVLLRQIQDPLPEPEYLRQLENGRVLDVIKKMTAKNPEERFQTYGGLAAALAALAPNVRVKPGAHAVTATVPTPPGEKPPAPSASTDATGEAQLATHVEMPKRSDSAQPATVTMPTPPGGAPVRERSTVMIFAFAGMVVAAICIVGIVALLRLQPAPGVVVEPRASKPVVVPTPTTTPPAVIVHPSPSPVGPSPVVFVPATPVVTEVPSRLPAPTPSGPLASPALRTQTPLPLTPVPQSVDTVIIGRPGSVAGEMVNILDGNFQPMARVPSGTRLKFQEIVQRGSRKWYEVIYEGKSGLVAFEDARPEVFSAGSNAPAPRLGLRVRLGAQGDAPDKTVPIYWGPAAKQERTRLPVGTELPAEPDSDSLGYYVTLPDGKQGFVFKGMAQPVP